MNGNEPNRDRSDGKTRSRLMPSPPPIPVRKKAGGPPMGPFTAPNAKKLANSLPSEARPVPYPPKTDSP